MYEIILNKGVDKDLKNFDQNKKNLIFKKIKKIGENPEIGKNLGNKDGKNLTGLKKVYVDSKKIRIVYKIKNNELIILVISVGKREKMEAYEKASLRI